MRMQPLHELVGSSGWFAALFGLGEGQSLVESGEHTASGVCQGARAFLG